MTMGLERRKEEKWEKSGDQSAKQQRGCKKVDEDKKESTGVEFSLFSFYYYYFNGGDGGCH
ncbi:hypothetical protein M406DRAFT_59457 [Cryphonectria parasitica EP155]|uniref:Uncharacterized protein n=1 Tax=Cryphonectria parasitica (strain ATCC 38755 / EP155) TaxID=660469 RepID=A0A9P5CTK7_CRYP1|nr:uncharacterized protein M406DRAFT_59457 [Cryphonectria parasitica EP155]KAF3770448.1 hypothetical protein M406DRAFT_59457 [Cryphonectria parasitica EP155]